jgi:hypothetical protein
VGRRYGLLYADQARPRSRQQALHFHCVLGRRVQQMGHACEGPQIAQLPAVCSGWIAQVAGEYIGPNLTGDFGQFQYVSGFNRRQVILCQSARPFSRYGVAVIDGDRGDTNIGGTGVIVGRGVGLKIGVGVAVGSVAHTEH